MGMRSRRVNYILKVNYTLKGQCDSRAAACGVQIMGDHGAPYHVQVTLVVTNCVAQKQYRKFHPNIKSIFGLFTPKIM